MKEKNILDKQKNGQNMLGNINHRLTNIENLKYV